MKRLAIVALTVVLTTTLLAGPAYGGLKFGVRQYSFHNAPLPSEQTMGAYFGLTGGDRVDIIFGLDHWKYSLSAEVDTATLGLGIAETKVSAGTTQLHGGVKFYLRPPMAKLVSPYVIGEFFYGLGSAEVEADDWSLPVDAIEDVLSPYGFIAGFGAEFFVTENFAVGGEVGLRYAVTKAEGDLGLLEQLDLNLGGLTKPVATAQEPEPEVKFTSTTIYTGISVTFAF